MGLLLGKAVIAGPWINALFSNLLLTVASCCLCWAVCHSSKESVITSTSACPSAIELGLMEAPGGVRVRHLKPVKGSKFEVTLFSWHLIFEQICFVQLHLLVQGTVLDFLNVGYMNGDREVRGQILLLALRPKKECNQTERIKKRILCAQFCFKINYSHTDTFHMKSKQISDRFVSTKKQDSI